MRNALKLCVLALTVSCVIICDFASCAPAAASQQLPNFSKATESLETTEPLDAAEPPKSAIVSKQPKTLKPSETAQPQAKYEASGDGEPSGNGFSNDITLTFTGDCMLASMLGGFEYNSFNLFAERTEPEYFFSQMAELFLSDDFTVGNCENVFTDIDLPQTEKDYEPAYWYRSGCANAGILAAGGIDAVSVANNHILDYGNEGRLDTTDALEAAGVLWGDASNTLYLEKNSITIALLCEQISSAGYVTPILNRLEKASGLSDFQIVYFHGGVENTYYPADAIIRACHALVDGGADLVIGHHPHVLQPLEVYGGVTIIYSLGNFLFGGGLGEAETAVYRLTLTAADGEISSCAGEIIACTAYTENKWQPAPVSDEGVREKILDFMYGLRDRPY